MKTNKDTNKESKKRENKEESNSEIVLLKNQLVRTLADYDNLRKRSEEEKSLWIRFSTQRVLTTLLPVLDNFESAQKHLGDPGLAIAISEFKRVFTEEGLEEINPAVDADFDHDNHEAVESIDTDDAGSDGKISEVVLPGWKFKATGSEGDPLARRDGEGITDGRHVIRHAKVKVYKLNKQ